MSHDQQFKADAGKSDPSLLEQGFPRALALVNATLDYGAQKYEAHSWRNVGDALTRYNRAARRHRVARDMDAIPGDGFHAILESCDPESGLPHIAHEIFNLLAMIELDLQSSSDYCNDKANELVRAIIGNMKAPPVGHKEPKNDQDAATS